MRDAATKPSSLRRSAFGLIAAFILLALILICVAARTGKFCFKRKEEPVEMKEVASFGTGTDPVAMSSSSAEAQFGPQKPSRYGAAAVDGDLTQPFLYDDPDQLRRYAKDETRAFNDEGIGSQAGSLPSLNADPTEWDWKDTLQVLGPKFSHLADFVRGDVSETSDEPGV